MHRFELTSATDILTRLPYIYVFIPCQHDRNETNCVSHETKGTEFLGRCIQGINFLHGIRQTVEVAHAPRENLDEATNCDLQELTCLLNLVRESGCDTIASMNCPIGIRQEFVLIFQNDVVDEVHKVGDKKLAFPIQRHICHRPLAIVPEIRFLV